MGILKKFVKLLNMPPNWERIDKVPEWIKFPVTDDNNFIFYVKGKKLPIQDSNL